MHTMTSQQSCCANTGTRYNFTQLLVGFDRLGFGRQRQTCRQTHWTARASTVGGFIDSELATATLSPSFGFLVIKLKQCAFCIIQNCLALLSRMRGLLFSKPCLSR